MGVWERQQSLYKIKLQGIVSCLLIKWTMMQKINQVIRNIENIKSFWELFKYKFLAVRANSRFEFHDEAV